MKKINTPDKYKKKGSVTMHDEFFGDEELPFYTEFKNEEKKDEEKKKKYDIKDIKELFKLNPVKKTKYSMGYIVILISSLFMIIPSVFVHSISSVMSCLIFGIIAFFSWNKLENLFEVIHEDDLMLENLKNMEKAFIKTSKFANLYKNSEILFSISYITINVVYGICIFLSVLFLRSAPYFLQNIILPLSICLNILCLHICVLKESSNFNFSIKKIKIIFILDIILFWITAIISLIMFKKLHCDFSLMFICIIINTIYIYFRKRNFEKN